MSLLAQLNADLLPFAKLMGVALTAAGPEGVSGALTVREDLCTAGNAVHGGALMAFADTLGGYAAFLNLPAGARTTTIESKTNFLGAATVGATLTGVCTPVHVGRRSSVWQTRITDPKGKLIALITQTQMVLTD